MMIRCARLTLVLAGSLLAACSSSASSDTDSDAPVADNMPTLHLEQTIFMTSSGQPQEEMAYRKMLADCQAAGEPITPVPPSEIGRIGRKKVAQTVEAHRWSRRVDAWKVDVSRPCQFVLKQTSEQEITTSEGKSYKVDLATGQGDVQDVGSPQPNGPVDDGDLDAVAAGAGWKREGKSQAAGQACDVWVAPAGDRYCVWSGGTQWGYSRSGINALDGDGESSGGAIVLQATPPAANFGWNVQTDTFTVGKAADESTFAIPANAKITASN
ncbi:hypothetical protein [Frateuria defendens]|uniref:hypothetical protein n=1 Tax=Frateuria defendens TaxID=2219559 RepID=UPI00066FCA79|nr:hypothetical protein [Frateuria defendens]